VIYMIYLFTANGLPPGGGSTVHIHTQIVHIYTQIVHRTTQKFGRVRAVPHLCGLYPGICLTTEEKTRKKTKSASWHDEDTLTYNKNT
jgi:hypothetical protein